MDWDFSSYALGATLYMPVIHHRVEKFMHGTEAFPSTSIVLCLEDALAQDDVARGLSGLRTLLQTCPAVTGAQVFVRPRNLTMAMHLADLAGIEKIEGFVAPKIDPDTAPAWLDLAQAANLRIMPTIETAEFFDPGRIAALRAVLDDYERHRIAAIRLGGNDLLAAMALRRQAGITSWEGPLAFVLSMASSMLISAGYPVAAPVFDIISDINTLRREVVQDVAAGFVSKTAIHPSQVSHILDAFRIAPAEMEKALAIAQEGASAVFRIDGTMCEPATHLAWARRILARNEIFGLRDEAPMLSFDFSDAASLAIGPI